MMQIESLAKKWKFSLKAEMLNESAWIMLFYSIILAGSSWHWHCHSLCYHKTYITTQKPEGQLQLSIYLSYSSFYNTNTFLEKSLSMYLWKTTLLLLLLMYDHFYILHIALYFIILNSNKFYIVVMGYEEDIRKLN